MNEENRIDTGGYNFDPETGERIVRSDLAEQSEASPSVEFAATAPAESAATPPRETARPAAPVFRDLPDAPKKKKKGGFFRVLALILCCALIGGAAGIGGAMFMMNRAGDRSAVTEEPAAVQEVLPESTQEPAAQEAGADEDAVSILTGRRDTSIISANDVDTGRLMTAAEVYAVNVASTVGISAEGTTNYWGYSTPSAASGSGFIISEDGYVITNYHVIEGSRSITVTTFDGDKYKAAIVGGDENNDIAVLKIEAEGLTPVVLGDSANMNVGDTVIAIGNPLGELTFSLTQGVISALNRNVTLSGNNSMSLIQTDCAINSGNSGGALFNLYGEVIGITNAKYSTSAMSGTASIDNIGFAIPINSVKNIVSSIIENGYISKPYIGVSVMTVSEDASIYARSGARVASVTPGAPADEAGLKENDIIYAVDGVDITTSGELVNIVTSKKPGDIITLSVYRDREEIEIKVVIGEQKQSAEVIFAEEEDDTYDPYGYGYGGNPFGFGWGDYFG
ncbi:MAG: trypsin-like peptidase domain-containing protein [Oscillospiraceae bacterium]|nr:trypsin-like peptidase domain-containing protein [Oscillospiraceae bacterium]